MSTEFLSFCIKDDIHHDKKHLKKCPKNRFRWACCRSHFFFPPSPPPGWFFRGPPGCRRPASEGPARPRFFPAGARRAPLAKAAGTPETAAASGEAARTQKHGKKTTEARDLKKCASIHALKMITCLHEEILALHFRREYLGGYNAQGPTYNWKKYLTIKKYRQSLFPNNQPVFLSSILSVCYLYKI